jgi:hypothetical protein
MKEIKLEFGNLLLHLYVIGVVIAKPILMLLNINLNVPIILYGHLKTRHFRLIWNGMKVKRIPKIIEN